MNVQGFVRRRFSLGRQFQSRRSLSPDTLHILGTQKIKRINPSLNAVGRAYLHIAAAEIEDAYAVTVFEDRCACVSLIELRANGGCCGRYVRLGQLLFRARVASGEQQRYRDRGQCKFP